jgi:hypothetical protein
VFRATGEAELAGYVSDDVLMIATALTKGVEDPILNAIWSAYAAGHVPGPPLEPIDGTLARVVGAGRRSRSTPKKGTKKRARSSSSTKRRRRAR